MNIVAIDTATEAFSVALKCGDYVLQRDRVEPRAHAKLLLPTLDELFAEAGLGPASLDAVAFGCGPGAFTGVRIATAAAQAIAMAHDIPVAPVSNLAAIAMRTYRECEAEWVAVAIDARMNEVYWGAYRVTSGLPPVPQIDERVCAPSEVDSLDNGWVAAGTGWLAYPQELTLASAIAADPPVTLPHARDILNIGEHMIARGEGVDAADAMPVYLRDNVAKTEAQRNA